MLQGLLQGIDFKKWIDENRSILKPPVGNKVVWEDGDFIVMVVGGPNNRKDHHYNSGPEFFYQVEGDISLNLYINGKFVETPIREGQIFLLPAGIPHSPQRPANTVGLVIEQKRRPDELDGLRWYCRNCATLLYEEYFQLANVETQFPPIFDRFFGNLELRTCKNCGTVMER